MITSLHPFYFWINEKLFHSCVYGNEFSKIRKRARPDQRNAKMISFYIFIWKVYFQSNMVWESEKKMNENIQSLGHHQEALLFRLWNCWFNEGTMKKEMHSDMIPCYNIFKVIISCDATSSYYTKALHFYCSLVSLFFKLFRAE